MDEPLSLEEILKEIDYSDVAPSIRNWLPQVKNGIGLYSVVSLLKIFNFSILLC